MESHLLTRARTGIPLHSEFAIFCRNAFATIRCGPHLPRRLAPRLVLYTIGSPQFATDFACLSVVLSESWTMAANTGRQIFFPKMQCTGTVASRLRLGSHVSFSSHAHGSTAATCFALPPRCCSEQHSLEKSDSLFFFRASERQKMSLARSKTHEAAHVQFYKFLVAL